ncbi:uncharacterized protein LOC114932033 [Nylanderia fulva]|uniref:uncharacterized protein LOC114932033 n=1 Tax=Nylanderia fulva TaxID=613905 RepID=UPI0010FAFC9A|nr:uncharacterized protein LOC114932033 [Nylanderia fulva]
MTKNVWTVLSPLLIINYVFGLRIIEFPIGYRRLWFSFIYILSSWSLYCFLMWYITGSLMTKFSKTNNFLQYLNCLATLISIVFGIYYDKKFRDSLKKLAIVDITLEKLGTTINYQQLHTKTVRLVLGWFALTILINFMHIVYLEYHFKYNTATAIYFTFMINHCSHINLIGDLTMTSILGYIGIKFDQVNEHLQEMASNNNGKIKQENQMLHPYQRKFLKILNNKWIIWIIIHLHLDLCKISREIDWIFGVQMTFKMGCYFSFLATNLSSLFDLIFFQKYIISFDNILFTSICLTWLFHNILKLFIINYVCEKVSAKANVTKNFVNKISYSTYNVEMCQNITQLSLQLAQSPLRFYGLGLFQFGFKFLQGVCAIII